MKNFFNHMSLVALATFIVLPFLDARDKSSSERVKYVQADAVTNGDGSKRHPFKTLADAEADEANWDVLIVRSSTIPLRPEVSFNLADGKKLIGEESPLEIPSLTQPTIIPALFTFDVIVASGEVTIENIDIRGANVAINYDKATNLTLKNLLISSCNIGLSSRGLESGKSHLEHVYIYNANTAINETLTIVGVTRHLFLGDCKIFNASDALDSATLAITSSRIKLKRCDIVNSLCTLSNAGEQTFIMDESSAINSRFEFANAANGLQSIEIIDSVIEDGSFQVKNEAKQPIKIKKTSFINSNLQLEILVGALSSIDLCESTLLNSNLIILNSGKLLFELKKTACHDGNMLLSTEKGSTVGLDLCEMTIENFGFTGTNSGTLSLELKKTSWRSGVFNLTTLVGATSSLDFRDGAFLNNSISLLNSGKESIHFQSISQQDSRLVLTNELNALSTLELIDSIFQNSSVNLNNSGEQISTVKGSRFVNSSFNLTNTVGKHSTCLKESSFADCNLFSTNGAAGTDSLSLSACTLINGSVLLNNLGDQSFAVKKSSFENGSGISSTNKGRSNLTIDESQFTNVSTAISIFDANSSTDLLLKDSVILFAGGAVVTTIADQAGTASIEKISLIKNSINVNGELYTAQNNSTVAQSGQTEVTIKDTIFYGFSVATISAAKPWTLLKIDILDSCFKSQFGTAFKSSGGVGNALIAAHKNSFANFQVDIDDTSVPGIKFDVSKNWWGHDPVQDCTIDDNCGEFQTCLKGICQGPIVSTPFTGSFVTPIDPLAHLIKCLSDKCR